MTDPKMHFEQVSLEKLTEQIVSGKISLMPAGDGRPGNESWARLCELATIEQDPEKLIALVKEINRLLEEKERAL